MNTPQGRFDTYISRIGAMLGHADRIEPFRRYSTGLLLPVARKSVESMAAHQAPERGVWSMVLSNLPSSVHTSARTGTSGETALAYRARLSGPPAGIRPGTFRGAHLARVPSSRLTVHSRLWIPDGRTHGLRPKNFAASRLYKQPALPESYRPRGRSGAATPARLDTHTAITLDRSVDSTPATLPMLRKPA